MGISMISFITTQHAFYFEFVFVDFKIIAPTINISATVPLEMVESRSSYSLTELY